MKKQTGRREGEHGAEAPEAHDGRKESAQGVSRWRPCRWRNPTQVSKVAVTPDDNAGDHTQGALDHMSAPFFIIRRDRMRPGKDLSLLRRERLTW